MLEELDRDIAGGRLYISPRLNQRGRMEYERLLREALAEHDDNWLAGQLTAGLLNDTEERRTKSGYTTARVPVTAPYTLAEGEFNRFYARGLCRRAIDEGIASVVVYRAKQVENPRSQSEAKIGTSMNPEALLEDLRTHQGMDTALRLPPGPNSGLSIRLP